MAIEKMSAKHTPAPWNYQGGDNASVEINIGMTTANVDRSDKNTGEYVISRDEMEANAKLIAAAPELLEALNRVNNTLTVHGKVDSETPLHEFILAAIKKATE
jgi:hypothetical protein